MSKVIVGLHFVQGDDFMMLYLTHNQYYFCATCDDNMMSCGTHNQSMHLMV